MSALGQKRTSIIKRHSEDFEKETGLKGPKAASPGGTRLFGTDEHGACAEIHLGRTGLSQPSNGVPFFFKATLYESALMISQICLQELLVFFYVRSMRKTGTMFALWHTFFSLRHSLDQDGPQDLRRFMPVVRGTRPAYR